MSVTPFSRSVVCLAALFAAAGPSALAVSLFSQNFDSLVLGPIVTFDSELRETEAWTATAPAGWTNDRSTVPTFGNPNSGVKEFEGWSFVDRDWWIATSGDQRRSEFISGSGVIAVADPDEWDDFGTPSPASIGNFDATLRTPFIPLTGAPVGEAIKVAFNSSWRPENNQKVTLTARFNDVGATTRELLRYESASTSTFFKADTPNEQVIIPLTDNTSTGGLNLSVPAGATQMELGFRLFDAGNNWWWAYDNLQVFTGANPPAVGALRVSVDRTTGAVSIVNGTGSPVALRGYSVVSSAGVFEESAADFLAPDSGWLRATRFNDASNDLSEVNLNNATLANGAQINFGNVWRKFYEEGSDVRFEYLVEGNDTPIPGIVEFTGNSGVAFDFLDLNFDGAINIADWETFKAGFGRSLLGKTEAQRYALADLDNDGRHTALDFQFFQRTYDAVNGAGAFASIQTIPEPSSLALVALAGAALVRFRRRAAGVVAVVALAAAAGDASAQLTLFSENFDGPNVDLGAFREEGVAGQENWTNTIPGWLNNNPEDDVPGYTGTPNNMDGVFDWADWAIVRKEAWIAADDQGRSNFTRAAGNVLVADPDEWDDADGTLRDPIAQAPNPDDLYDVFIRTPVINIPAGIPAGRIRLSFDSSWLGDEFQDDLDMQNNQTALVSVMYNGGPKNEVFRRESDPESPTYDPDQTNQRLSGIDLEYDGVATSLQLEIGMVNAWNDWWWAVDNIQVSVPSNPLKLRINTFDGRGYLVGDDQIATTINYFAVESDNGVLTGSLATGLSGASLPAADGPDAGTVAGNSPGERWELLGDPETASRLFAEAFLFGTTAFDDTDSINLGPIMNPATLVANRDVRFSYAISSGDIIEVPASAVEYFFDNTAVTPGDFNRDGRVDNGDLDLLLGNWGSASVPPAWTGTFTGPAVDNDELDALLGNWGFGTSVAIPEPTGVALGGLALLLTGLRRRARRVMATLAVTSAVMTGPMASAQTLDRLYRFGDAAGENAVAGQFVGSGAGAGGATFDGAGSPGMNQLIDLLAKGPNPIAIPRYVTVNDRPDGVNGLGIALNPFPAGSTFNRQYLHTGFREALNFPERSPSSTFSPGGTINYDLISDRGFQLWAKPTRVTESHVVMDSNQHGVLINAAGKFAMRYGYDEVEIAERAAAAGQPTSAFETIFDYASNVTAVANQWHHLSVVRPFGPNRGSILYVNGVAAAAAKGEYLVEEVVNDDFGMPDLTRLDSSPLVVGASTGKLAFGQDRYFSGVVDDLEMFVMGLNSGGSFGEYEFVSDNDYAAAFAPATAGDLDGDNDVDLTDATTFAANWLNTKRLTWTDPLGDEQSLVVGDLQTRGQGDFNYDGIVNLRDWAILNSASSTSAAFAMRIISGEAIPEPSALGIAGVALLASAMRRARR